MKKEAAAGGLLVASLIIFLLLSSASAVNVNESVTFTVSDTRCVYFIGSNITGLTSVSNDGTTLTLGTGGIVTQTESGWINVTIEGLSSEEIKLTINVTAANISIFDNFGEYKLIEGYDYYLRYVSNDTNYQKAVYEQSGGTDHLVFSNVPASDEYYVFKIKTSGGGGGEEPGGGGGGDTPTPTPTPPPTRPPTPTPTLKPPSGGPAPVVTPEPEIIKVNPIKFLGSYYQRIMFYSPFFEQEQATLFSMQTADIVLENIANKEVQFCSVDIEGASCKVGGLDNTSIFIRYVQSDDSVWIEEKTLKVSAYDLDGYVGYTKVDITIVNVGAYLATTPRKVADVDTDSRKNLIFAYDREEDGTTYLKGYRALPLTIFGGFFSVLGLIWLSQKNRWLMLRRAFVMRRF